MISITDQTVSTLAGQDYDCHIKESDGKVVCITFVDYSIMQVLLDAISVHWYGTAWNGGCIHQDLSLNGAARHVLALGTSGNANDGADTTVNIVGTGVTVWAEAYTVAGRNHGCTK